MTPTKDEDNHNGCDEPSDERSTNFKKFPCMIF